MNRKLLPWLGVAVAMVAIAGVTAAPLGEGRTPTSHSNTSLIQQELPFVMALAPSSEDSSKSDTLSIQALREQRFRLVSRSARPKFRTISQTTRVDSPPVVTAESLNEELGGRLSGLGQTYVDAGKKFGIDPAFLAAISMHETANGTSDLLRRYNNVGGMMTADGPLSFPSVQASIYRLAWLLRNYYINDGLVTPADIQKRYAPVGVSNDPTNLNQYWLKDVSLYWKQLTEQV